jgi:hypothetical protein
MSSVTRINDAISRIIETVESPEYQAQAERLRAEWDAFERGQEEQRRRDRLTLTGIPRDLWAAIDSPRETPAMVEARGFLAGPRGYLFLILGGVRGLGKTFAGSWACAQVGGRFVDCAGISQASTFDEPYWADLARARLLVIDEWGAEHGNPAFDSNLYATLERRYRDGRRTLICANLNAGDFRARLPEAFRERLLDRLRTAGRFVVLADGPSLRTHWSETDATEAP